VRGAIALDWGYKLVKGVITGEGSCQAGLFLVVGDDNKACCPLPRPAQLAADATAAGGAQLSGAAYGAQAAGAGSTSVPQQLPQPPQQPLALQQAPAGRVGQQQVGKTCKVPACPWGRYGTPVPIGMGGCFCRAEEKKIKGRPPPPPHPTT
jgi:hypothetical protein